MTQASQPAEALDGPGVVSRHVDQRHSAIMAWAREHGRLDVGEFAAKFKVAPETVRADLAELERHGVLRRVRGGAVLVDVPVAGSPAAPGLWNAKSMTAEKDRIAEAALAEVPEEGAILLDVSSTVDRLAAMLPGDRELTIVTNSMCLALSLSAQPNFTVMLLGGRIRSSSLATVDSWAVRALADTYVDVAFLGTSGLSVERGLTTPDTAEAMVKRAAIVCARRTVVLADHTKIGRHYLARFADLTEVDTFITDAGIDPQRGHEIAAAGSRVVTV